MELGMEVFLLEESYLHFCKCSVSRLLESGNLYKSDWDGGEDLWYSEEPLRVEDLEDKYTKGLLKRITPENDLAERLGIATRHWRHVGLFDSPKADFVYGFRWVKLNINYQGGGYGV